jgi:hypothetical protein
MRTVRFGPGRSLLEYALPILASSVQWIEVKHS